MTVGGYGPKIQLEFRAQLPEPTPAESRCEEIQLEFHILTTHGNAKWWRDLDQWDILRPQGSPISWLIQTIWNNMKQWNMQWIAMNPCLFTVFVLASASHFDSVIQMAQASHLQCQTTNILQMIPSRENHIIIRVAMVKPKQTCEPWQISLSHPIILVNNATVPNKPINQSTNQVFF